MCILKFAEEKINPNPSPTGKIWFGLYWFGASGHNGLNKNHQNAGRNTHILSVHSHCKALLCTIMAQRRCRTWQRRNIT